MNKRKIKRSMIKDCIFIRKMLRHNDDMLKLNYTIKKNFISKKFCYMPYIRNKNINIIYILCNGIPLVYIKNKH